MIQTASGKTKTLQMHLELFSKSHTTIPLCRTEPWKKCVTLLGGTVLTSAEKGLLAGNPQAEDCGAGFTGESRQELRTHPNALDRIFWAGRNVLHLCGPIWPPLWLLSLEHSYCN